MQYESGTFTVSRVSTAAGASSKNDGAGCADEEDPHDDDSGGVSVVSLTPSQSLGTCSTGGGTKTSTLSLANSSGSTAYVTVEYSTNSGSSWTVHTDAEEADNLSISSGTTNTSLTKTVSHGSSIQWRYKSSNTSSNWTGLSYVTDNNMNSSTVDCDPEATVSQSLGSCSAASGSKTSTLSIRNDDSATVYYLVEYSTNGGSSYSTASSNLSVGAGVTNTSLSQAVADGLSLIHI